jgi:glycosyltransferase involved in cell wall biosynthesis
MDPLRIAVIAPLTEAVPPKTYGGTERVVSLLTEELVRRGHQVTLFASGDSQTSAELVACCDQSLRLDPEVTDYVAHTVIELDHVYRQAERFDVIHNHVDYFAFPVAHLCPTPTLTTTHGRLDLPEVRRVYRTFPTLPLAAISQDQRDSLSGVNWLSVVHNGIDIDTFQFRPDPGDYLVFLGRISPEKRADRAIELARDVGMRLVIAAKVDPVDQDYFDYAIAPLIEAHPSLVEFIGEVDQQGKNELLGGAYAYLFPIDWPEPFGLTMAESLATGTPVVAFRAGSVSEVVEDGVTGFVCDTLHDMAEAIPRVRELDRKACRQRAERRFSPATMTDGYELAYAALRSGVDRSSAAPVTNGVSPRTSVQRSSIATHPDAK